MSRKMPQMPSPKKDESAVQHDLSSPTSGVLHSAPDLDMSDTLIPALVDSPEVVVVETEDPEDNSKLLKKPMIEGSEEDLVSNVRIPKTPKGGIEVVATRQGFYNQHRLNEGDKFTVASFEDLGEWMKATDPDMDKKRREFLQAKKAKK